MDWTKGLLATAAVMLILAIAVIAFIRNATADDLED